MSRTRHRAPLPLLMFMLLAAAGARAQESFPATHFSSLSSVEEVPKLFLDAAGLALYHLEGDSLAYRVTVAMPGEEITGAGFYRARFGGVGELLHEIPFPAGARTVGGVWSGISPGDVDLLNSGGIYINIRTAAHPTGTIRAQVERFPNLYAGLSRAAVVPPADNSSGFGSIYTVLDRGARRLDYYATWQRLTGPATAAHLHRGFATENGPATRSLTLTPADSFAHGSLSGLTDQEIDELVSGRAYVDIHTGQYPEGEIRGTLLPTDVYSAFITPSNVVPSVPASEWEGLGYGLLIRDLPTRWSFVYTSFVYHPTDTLTSAHLHLGKRGEPGSPFRTLLLDGAYQQTPDLLIRGDDTLRLFRDTMVYADYHTSFNPGGEVRGQLVPSSRNLNLPFASAASVEDPAGEAARAVGALRYDAAAGAVLFIGDPNVDGELRIFTPLGRLVGTAPVERGRARYRVEGLPNGAYLAQVVGTGIRIAAILLPIGH